MSARFSSRQLLIAAVVTALAVTLSCSAGIATTSLQLNADVSLADVDTIEISAARLDGSVLYQSGRKSATLDPTTGRHELDVTAKLPASTDLVFHADAYGSDGTLIASALRCRCSPRPRAPR